MWQTWIGRWRWSSEKENSNFLAMFFFCKSYSLPINGKIGPSFDHSIRHPGFSLGQFAKQTIAEIFLEIAIRVRYTSSSVQRIAY